MMYGTVAGEEEAVGREQDTGGCARCAKRGHTGLEPLTMEEKEVADGEYIPCQQQVLPRSIWYASGMSQKWTV